jgi:hypothetical protein
MSRRSFTVTAQWDAEAGVYYSDSDIIGLHIEATTLDEFEAILHREGPDLVVANHFSKPELSRSSLRELIPTIFLKANGPRLNAA